MAHFQEINFDGLIGPTHNFAGLAYGNRASSNHSKQQSNPKKAALQGLEKMAKLMRMGLPQGILPPHERLHIPTLRALGFTQHPQQLIPKLAQQSPQLLAQLYSASSMWVANAGTTAPACDTQDGKTHFTPANLSSMLHRSIEPVFTSRLFRTIFSDQRYFNHHKTLPGTAFFGDEGAANHTRFCSNSGNKGFHCFVYGQSHLQEKPKPAHFPARQSLEASEAIARLHQLHDNNTMFIQQNPTVIDQGVFHNDVIAVGSKNIFLCHEQAFIDQKRSIQMLKEKQEIQTNEQFYIIEAPTQQVSIEDAINTYLFNTQLVFPTQEKATLIAPIECYENQRVKNFIDETIAADNPVNHVEYFDLRQSMKNGGGPACLRLRVMLSDKEIDSLSTNTILTDALYESIKHWIIKHYRDELSTADLANPQLYLESNQALDELSQILQLGPSIYDFQRI